MGRILRWSALCVALSAGGALAQATPPSWFQAAAAGDAATVQDMLDQGQPIDAADAESNTAVHLAADKCQAAIVRLLVGRGANSASANKWNDTPLVIATARCGAGSETAVALGGAPSAPIVPFTSNQLAAGETSEPNTLPCPATQSDQRAFFDQLALGAVKKDQATGWAVKLTQIFPARPPEPYNTGATGFVADILLPTVTIRGLVFRGRTEGYDGPIRRFNACGMTFLVKSSWGHPYIQNAITIESIGGPAGGL